MNKTAKYLSLTACALAASLFLSGCGGAEGDDTVAPTVAITSVASGSTITFTFTFDEALGTGTGDALTKEEITVEGGTAGEFNVVDTTHATLTVTATASVVSVSVAANKFADVSHNFNTASATASKAVDSETTGLVIANFDTVVPGVRAPDSGGTGTITATLPTGGSTSALALLRSGGAAWALNVLDATVPFTTTRKTLSARVYSPTAGIPMKIKIEAVGGGDTGEVAANETVVEGWQTLTWTFSSANPTKTYNVIVLLPNIGTVDAAPGKTYYFDDITLLPAPSSGCGTTEPNCAPTTVVPSGALTIYSDAASTAGFNAFPNWGQATQYSEATLASNKSLKYSNLNYEGIEFTAVNVSAKGKVHFDFWSPDLTSVDVYLISPGPKEQKITKALTTKGWNSIDIDLSEYTVPDKTGINQIKLVAAGSGTLYVDNIYFWGTASGACGTTEPTCAPATVIPSGALTIYSDAAATAGFNAFPNWGQATQYSEATLASNKSLKYSNLNYEGIEFTAVNVSAKGKVHFDFWSPDLTSVDVYLISPGPKEQKITKALTTKGWNSIDIDLSEYTVPDKTGINQIKLVAAGSGTLYVDNINFWGTASSSNSSSGSINPNATAGSGGAVTIPLLTASYLGDFGAAGDAVFAGDYKGSVDANGKSAAWASAASFGVASNGNIGYFQADSLSNSSQKLEENGWVAGLTDNAGGVPSFFRFFILNAPAATFTDSYMGLFVNAPNNGTVNVSNYGSIKFRAWGPAQMYQASFSPTLEVTLAGAKVAGCTTTGSGGTEIKKTFVANQKIGAASTYKLPLAAWTVTGVCGSDTTQTAAASVLAALARVVVNVPGTSFNFTEKNSDGLTYATGLNLGPIVFTNN